MWCILGTELSTVLGVDSYWRKRWSRHIDSSFSWSTHIDHVIKKATARLYFLKQLNRAGLSSSHLLHFYITVIRSVLEYCAPVWHYAITKAQSESLEPVQKCAVHIVHNLTRGMPYSSMLFYSNFSSLALVEKIFLVVLKKCFEYGFLSS